jgi:hypothetical protein
MISNEAGYFKKTVVVIRIMVSFAVPSIQQVFSEARQVNISWKNSPGRDTFLV